MSARRLIGHDHGEDAWPTIDELQATTAQLTAAAISSVLGGNAPAYVIGRASAGLGAGDTRPVTSAKTRAQIADAELREAKAAQAIKALAREVDVLRVENAALLSDNRVLYAQRGFDNAVRFCPSCRDNEARVRTLEADVVALADQCRRLGGHGL